MGIDNTTFYTLAISLFFLSIILIILIVSYLQMYKRLRLLQKEHDHAKDVLNQKTTRALETAQNKADELINTAAKKAEEIINNTKITSNELQKTLDKNLEGLAKEQQAVVRKHTAEVLDDYKNELSDIKGANLRFLQEIIKNLKTDANNQIETFRKSLENKTLKSDDAVEERIEKAYDQIKIELEIKKQEKLKKLDEKIFEIVNIATKNILGKTLPLKDQEDLVFKALDSAKKDGII